MKPIFIKKNSGFSLVELLIAIFLGLIVITAIYSLFIVQNHSYVNQNLTAEMQQNVRLAMDILSADFRLAGFGFSIKTTSDPDTIGGTYNSAAGRIFAVTPTNNSTAPDSITIRYGTNPDPANPNANVTLTNAITDSRLENSLVISNTTGFAAGDYVVISDGQNASCLLINDSPSGNTLSYTSTGSNIFPSPGRFTAGSHIYKLKQVSYRISNNVLQSQTNNGTWEDVVNNVEDLQLGYQGTSGTWGENPSPVNRSTITDVQLNILARSNTQDLQFTGQRPQIRDHVAGAADHYRRRLLTSTVKMRNL